MCSRRRRQISAPRASTNSRLTASRPKVQGSLLMVVVPQAPLPFPVALTNVGGNWQAEQKLRAPSTPTMTIRTDCSDCSGACHPCRHLLPCLFNQDAVQPLKIIRNHPLLFVFRGRVTSICRLEAIVEGSGQNA